jgi:TraG P-loop domain
MVLTRMIEAVEPPVACTRPRGELWLKSAATGLYTQVLRDGQAANDNILVLGPSGSGQGVLLGRLALNAYENGERVVMLCLRQRTRALYQLTQNLGGACHAWEAGAQIGFNPFLAVLERPEELPRLHQLLLTLLGAEAGRDVEQHAGVLLGLLEYYYQQAAWKKAQPGFSTFFKFITSAATRSWAAARWPRAEVALFMSWFTAVGPVFCAEEELGYLLNASAEELVERLAPSNRLLYLELGVSEAPDAQECRHLQYSVWLWLHAVDCYVATGGRPTTVVLDELPSSCLQEDDAAFWTDYLVQASAHERKLVMGWHLTLEQLFSYEHPAATKHIRAFGYQFLLPDSPHELHYSLMWHSVDEFSFLTDEEITHLSTPSSQQWQVFVRSHNHCGKYLIGMKPEELGLYLSPETLAREARFGYLPAHPTMHQ